MGPKMPKSTKIGTTSSARGYTNPVVTNANDNLTPKPNYKVNCYTYSVLPLN